LEHEKRYNLSNFRSPWFEELTRRLEVVPDVKSDLPFVPSWILVIIIFNFSSPRGSPQKKAPLPLEHEKRYNLFNFRSPWFEELTCRLQEVADVKEKEKEKEEVVKIVL
jgi:hypothetical protein